MGTQHKQTETIAKSREDRDSKRSAVIYQAADRELTYLLDMEIRKRGGEGESDVM